MVCLAFASMALTCCLPCSAPHPPLQGYIVALLSTLMAPRAIPSTSQPNPLVENGLEALLEGDEGQDSLAEWRARDGYDDFPDYIITCPLDPQDELVTGTYSIISLTNTTGKCWHLAWGWGHGLKRAAQWALVWEVPQANMPHLPHAPHTTQHHVVLPSPHPQTPPSTKSRWQASPPS